MVVDPEFEVAVVPRSNMTTSAAECCRRLFACRGRAGLERADQPSRTSVRPFWRIGLRCRLVTEGPVSMFASKIAYLGIRACTHQSSIPVRCCAALFAARSIPLDCDGPRRDPTPPSLANLGRPLPLGSILKPRGPEGLVD